MIPLIYHEILLGIGIVIKEDIAMYSEKALRLRNMLEVFIEQGGAIFQNEKPATAMDIVNTQQVYEEYTYLPEFIVKNESGEIKEIWYGDITKSNRG